MSSFGRRDSRKTTVRRWRVEVVQGRWSTFYIQKLFKGRCCFCCLHRYCSIGNMMDECYKSTSRYKRKTLCSTQTRCRTPAAGSPTWSSSSPYLYAHMHVCMHVCMCSHLTLSLPPRNLYRYFRTLHTNPFSADDVYFSLL
jgi:hypothetical protein